MAPVFLWNLCVKEKKKEKRKERIKQVKEKNLTNKQTEKNKEKKAGSISQSPQFWLDLLPFHHAVNIRVHGTLSVSQRFLLQ